MLSSFPIWNKQHRYTFIVTIPQIYYKGVNKLKTAEEIIAYLKAEMDEAIEMHDAAKESRDMAQAHATLLKAYIISELLDNIEQ